MLEEEVCLALRRITMLGFFLSSISPRVWVLIELHSNAQDSPAMLTNSIRACLSVYQVRHNRTTLPYRAILSMLRGLSDIGDRYTLYELSLQSVTFASNPLPALSFPSLGPSPYDVGIERCI